jgi:actin-related protein
MQSPVVVFENGGSRLRAGFGGEAQPRLDVPNCTARLKRSLRLLVADEVEGLIKDASSLHYYRPLDRGVLTDAPCEELVWRRALGSAALRPAGCTEADAWHEGSTLLVSAAPFSPPSCLAALDELAFETLRFGALARTSPAALAAASFRVGDAEAGCGLALPATGTGVLVDVGFSACTVTPFVGGAALARATRTAAVGGKALTNGVRIVPAGRAGSIRCAWLWRCFRWCRDTCFALPSAVGPLAVFVFVFVRCGPVFVALGPRLA